MNTNLRYMHPREFDKAQAKLKQTHGLTWDELFPQEAYHQLDPYHDPQKRAASGGIPGG